MKKKSMNIPIFIPHLGCPNDCVFCNQRHISGVEKEQQNEQQLRHQIECYLETGKERKDIEIAFFGGSFTGIDVEIQKFYLEIGKEYVEKYQLKGIRMSTRPDYISKEILSFLSDYPVSAIELGVQSMDEQVLKHSKRNHTVEDVYQAVNYIRQYPIELGLQVMVGLPKDTYETFLETIQKMIALQPETLRIYPTLVIQNTELDVLYKQGKYEPLTVEEAVVHVGNVLPLIYQAGIQVIRIGLQANEGLNTGAYIAGPYHPAFGELVSDYCLYQEIVQKMNVYQREIRQYNGDVNLVISGNKKMYQRLMGHRRKNYENICRFFQEHFEKNVMFKIDLSLKNNEVVVSYGQESKLCGMILNKV